MADAYFIVTLSSADAGSGPNYNVLYSTDCISYSAANPATITLNNVGSQAYITVPDTTQCIKLTNINSNCTNSVTSSLTITTTTTTTAAPTTTTTLAPTTTTTLAPTTTTTLAPTTTTTTQCDCVQTVTLNVTEAGTFDFNDCFAIPRSTNVNVGTELIDYSTDGCIKINTFAGSAGYTVQSYGPCCTPTTTTTTTTTAAPSVYQWSASVTNFTDHSASCALPFTTTYYTSTNFLYLNTTIIYLDAGLTTTLNGGNGFVKMSRAGVTNVYSVRVNSSGLVTRLTVCPSTTTTTTTTTTAP